MASERSLDGSVVAVIGVTGGLGSAIAHDLVARGATVYGVNRSGPDAATGVAVDLSVDVRDAGAGDAIVRGVLEKHGRLDGVVVAAGIVAFGDVAETDDVVLEELMLTNSMAPFWIARRVAEPLAESRGFFVNVSGMIADTPMPGMAAYAASKAAAAAGLVALRKEWRRAKVLVVDARPPHTETGLATRPLAGTSPTMPTGLDPSQVARRIVDAVVAGETELTPDAFGT